MSEQKDLDILVLENRVKEMEYALADLKRQWEFKMNWLKNNQPGTYRTLAKAAAAEERQFARDLMAHVKDLMQSQG